MKVTSCGEKFELQKEWLNSDQQDAAHKIATKLTGKAFAVHYIGNFNNDTLSVYLNDKLHSKINIEQSSDADEKSYVSFLSIFEEMKRPVLKIKSQKKNNCISMTLDWKYPIIYAWLENDKWMVRYSNFYHTDNFKRTADISGS